MIVGYTQQQLYKNTYPIKNCEERQKTERRCGANKKLNQKDQNYTTDSFTTQMRN